MTSQITTLLTEHLNKDCVSIIESYTFHEYFQRLAQEYLEVRLPKEIYSSLNITQVAYDSIPFLIEEFYATRERYLERKEPYLMRNDDLMYYSAVYKELRGRQPALSLFPFFRNLDQLLDVGSFESEYSSADDKFYLSMFFTAIDKDEFSKVQVLRKI